MNLRNTFHSLDKLLKRLFQVDCANEYNYYVRRNKSEHKADILHDASILDNKCSALLSHISLMFILIGLFVTKEDSQGIVHLLLIIEFIAYLLCALLILRCQDLMGPPFRQLPEADQDINEVFLTEIGLRRATYAWVLRAVFVLTVSLIPLILFRNL